ncbi:aldo/keto reductase [Vibrio maerlii]|uniref:aldo/keto reductase n=1 Tax=Vibrio maerlii TaxID=2231648 RepID=UPI000E3D11F3|nr:aldo/keto reductase [Vibrio maerlii]
MTNKTLPLATHLKDVSQIAYGCMGLGGGWDSNPITDTEITQARNVIETALDAGINIFDHADIYTHTKAEQAFGKVLASSPALRDDMYIQSKCGIRFEDEMGVGRYDFSANWISQSVDGILERLNIEQLDVLLLHRPDPLMELDEVAETLHKIHAAGKVAHFGVSNMSGHQINFLQSALNLPIVANQVEMSLSKLDFFNDVVMVGTEGFNQGDITPGTMEYCRLNNIQIQAWGCLAQGKYSEKGLDSEFENVRLTTQYVMELAAKYQVPSEAIVLAFLLRHPANIQPVIGTTNLERIKASALATTIELTREEWYTLFVRSRGQRMP